MNPSERIQTQINESIQTKQLMLESLVPSISKACQIVSNAILQGQKILFFGNGGSASDAQHLAAEFVGRYEEDREPLAAIALTTDTSIITAVANDYTFESIFARQIKALAKPNDVAIGITTSGNSPNVIKGIQTAQSLGLKTIAMTGRKGGKLRGIADIELIVPSQTTSRIQECHIMMGHMICDWVDLSIKQKA